MTEDEKQVQSEIHKHLQRLTGQRRPQTPEISSNLPFILSKGTSVLFFSPELGARIQSGRLSSGVPGVFRGIDHKYGHTIEISSNAEII